MTAVADLPPAASGVQSPDRYFTSAGARLRYRDEGRGAAVILVHGWTLDLEMWAPQAAALQTAFRVVRLDRRGFGLSSGRPGIDQDVADLEALCRHLGLRRTALIGMSQGARAVLAFAAHAPQTVSCLVLDGPPGTDASAAAEDEVPLAHFRVLARSKGVEAVRREWAAHPLMRLRTPDPGTRSLLKSIVARYPGNDLLEPTDAAAAARAHTRPEFVAAAALVVSGALDSPARIQAATTLARRLPHAEHAIVAGAGHLPNLDSPDAYNSLVGAFLSRHASALT